MVKKKRVYRYSQSPERSQRLDIIRRFNAAWKPYGDILKAKDIYRPTPREAKTYFKKKGAHYAEDAGRG